MVMNNMNNADFISDSPVSQEKLIDIPGAVKLISSWDNILILTHISPDGDTLGSAIALCHLFKHFGKNVNILNSEPIPSKYSFLYDNITLDKFIPEHIIAIDIANLQLLGNKLSVYGDMIDLAIDHHISNTLYAKHSLLFPQASAVGEIIFDLFENLNVPLNKNSAAALYTAISTDTGCFKYSNTTSKTHEITSKLLEHNFDFSTINYNMFDLKSVAQLKLEQMSLDSLELFFDGKCALIYVTKEMFQKSGASEDSTDGLANIPRQVEGLDIGITIKEKDTSAYKVSIRTNEKVNASKVCNIFGGGGHKCAAGCFISDSLKNVKTKLLDAVKSELDNIL